MKSRNDLHHSSLSSLFAVEEMNGPIKGSGHSHPHARGEEQQSCAGILTIKKAGAQPENAPECDDDVQAPYRGLRAEEYLVPSVPQG